MNTPRNVTLDARFDPWALLVKRHPQSCKYHDMQCSLGATSGNMVLTPDPVLDSKSKNKQTNKQINNQQDVCSF